MCRQGGCIRGGLGEGRSLLRVSVFWSAFAVLVLYLTGLHPLAFLVLIFPAFPPALPVSSRLDINRLPWMLPYVNNIRGSMLFLTLVLALLP